MVIIVNKIGLNMRGSLSQGIRKASGRLLLRMEINIKGSLGMILYGEKEECLRKMVLCCRPEYGKEGCLYRRYNDEKKRILLIYNHRSIF